METTHGGNYVYPIAQGQRYSQWLARCSYVSDSLSVVETNLSNELEEGEMHDDWAWYSVSGYETISTLQTDHSLTILYIAIGKLEPARYLCEDAVRRHRKVIFVQLHPYLLYLALLHKIYLVQRKVPQAHEHFDMIFGCPDMRFHGWDIRDLAIAWANRELSEFCSSHNIEMPERKVECQCRRCRTALDLGHVIPWLAVVAPGGLTLDVEFEISAHILVEGRRCVSRWNGYMRNVKSSELKAVAWREKYSRRLSSRPATLRISMGEAAQPSCRRRV